MRDGKRAAGSAIPSPLLRSSQRERSRAKLSLFLSLRRRGLQERLRVCMCRLEYCTAPRAVLSFLGARALSLPLSLALHPAVQTIAKYLLFTQPHTDYYCKRPPSCVCKFVYRCKRPVCGGKTDFSDSRALTRQMESALISCRPASHLHVFVRERACGTANMIFLFPGAFKEREKSSD